LLIPAEDSGDKVGKISDTITQNCSYLILGLLEKILIKVEYFFKFHDKLEESFFLWLVEFYSMQLFLLDVLFALIMVIFLDEILNTFEEGLIGNLDVVDVAFNENALEHVDKDL
jgi:hypothetical protein